jgi:hypothetical protein
MATITLGELQAQGYTLVMGAGERVQMWSGIKAGTTDSQVLIWDSVTLRKKSIEDMDPHNLLMMIGGGLAAVFELVDKLVKPTAITAANANGVNQILGQALKDN